MDHSQTTVKSSRQPGQYVLLKNYVRRNFKEGDRLPSDKQLAATLGISRYATLKALNEMSGEGSVERVHGRGTFVTKPDQASYRTAFKQVAFLADEFESGLLVDVMRGVEEYYRLKSINLALLNNNYDHTLESSRIQHLRETPYSGAIVFCSGNDASLEKLRRLLDVGYPLVNIDRHFSSLDCPFVETDHEKLAYDAVTHLLALGHRKIAHIGLAGFGDVAKKRISSARDREGGYRRALEEAGIPFRPEYVQRLEGFSLDERPSKAEVFAMGYVPMHKLLSLPDPPTAVYVLTEEYAQGAYQAIQTHGLNVPGDVSLICTEAPLAAPPLPVTLTRMVQPGRKIGAVAAELLEKLMNREVISQRHVKLKAQLVVGDSTVPCNGE